MKRKFASVIRHLRLASRNIDVAEAFRYLVHSLRYEVLTGPLEYTQRTSRAFHPVELRRRTSDHLVFAQIFVLREYRTLDRLQNVEVVVDCGANVGYSSVYFLSAFPKCRVIAVEPDPDNYRMLRKNLEPYGERALPLCAAIWSHPGLLALKRQPYRDGREWSRQVGEPTREDTAKVEAIDLQTLLTRVNAPHVSVLKMEIEGAEAVVLAADTSGWLPKVDVLAIELHHDSGFGPATPVFEQVMSRERFRVERSGELAICRPPPIPASGIRQ